MVPSSDIAKIDADEAYSRLIELITEHPVGSVQEVMEWKNEGHR